jgi:hypothetical protein
MINTVQEDGIAASYQIPEGIGEISISDFELDEDDFLSEGLDGVPKKTEPLIHYS